MPTFDEVFKSVNVPTWEKFDEEVVKETHGEIRLYRDLYYGNHIKIFERANELVKNGEITDNLRHGKTVNSNGNVRTPYIVANVSKLIPEIPAFLVSRAIGEVKPAKDTVFQVTGSDGLTTGQKLSDIVKEIVKKSKLKVGHYSNILQNQIDGGIIGIPVKDENGVKIDFKKRELYFPHEDDLGCDVVYKRRLENKEGKMNDYLQIHRERVFEGNLYVKEMLHEIDETNQLTMLSDEEAKWILGMDKLEDVFTGRTRPFVVYWANEATFDYPLGLSSLRNQENKQDEINWTLTQLGIVFQRNGKPRLAVTEDLMNALRNKAFERYGDETKIDHRDLELVTIDENGKSMEIIQVDVTKIGNIEWVKDLMKLMFIETKTSEKAVDFYLEGGNSAASGIAKFYDLFTSIVKAEKIVGEYVDFLQELFENAFWLMKQDAKYETLEVAEPTIQVLDMLPTTTQEVITSEVAAVEGGIRSVERAVKNINPHDDQVTIDEEIKLIEENKASVNSQSASNLSFNNLSNLMDNRGGQGQQQGQGQQGQGQGAQQGAQGGQPNQGGTGNQGGQQGGNA